MSRYILFLTEISQQKRLNIFRWPARAGSQRPSQNLPGLQSGEREEGVNPGIVEGNSVSSYYMYFVLAPILFAKEIRLEMDNLRPLW